MGVYRISNYQVGESGAITSLTFPPALQLGEHRLRPMVSAYNETVTYNTVPASDAHGNSFTNSMPVSDRDTILSSMLGGLPLYSDVNHGYHALAGIWETISVPLCGQMQRYSFWSKGCSTVLGGQPVQVPINGIRSAKRVFALGRDGVGIRVRWRG